ncbi:MAG TPA: hypothetical protein VIH18_18260 [Candidatus Binatia bacterium]
MAEEEVVMVEVVQEVQEVQEVQVVMVVLLEALVLEVLVLEALLEVLVLEEEVLEVKNSQRCRNLDHCNRTADWFAAWTVCLIAGRFLPSAGCLLALSPLFAER